MERERSVTPKTLESPLLPQPDCPLVRASERLNHWLCEQALPYWLHHGIDSASGAHHEQLLADGRPDLQANIRVRVQARQIFPYSFAYSRGDRKSTRLNSSHVAISYAVFCSNKNNKNAKLP